jgi:hypothetical protein
LAITIQVCATNIPAPAKRGRLQIQILKETHHMPSATITNSARDAAERGSKSSHATNSTSNSASNSDRSSRDRATIRGGRTSTPLSGQIRGTGVPSVRGNKSMDWPAVLCNITEQSWILHRTHGTFFVAGAHMECAQPSNPGPASRSLPRFAGAGRSEATASEPSNTPPDHSENIPVGNPNPGAGLGHPRPCKSGQATNSPYALTPISARTGAIDLGDKRTLEFPISARDIAEDLAREINSDGGESSFFGVFVCEGSEPTDEELNDAHEKLITFYRSLVAAADRQWERTHQVAFISDLERRAARELRLEKDWSYEPHQQMDCPACGEKLRPGVAVCRVCGAVLDRAKAAQYGLLPAPPSTDAPSRVS